jgi:AcrR family transcriptional regulator
MEHVDRRIRRTKKSLGDALIAIALEKGYDDITIQEITDRADIGYRTFFRHYADKEELLRDVLQTIRQEMPGLMSPPPFEVFIDPNIQASDLPNITVLFRHVQDNSDLYRVLLLSDHSLIQPLKAFAIEEFKNNFGELRETSVPFDITAYHMVSAMIALIRWWLEADMPYTPEEMGEFAFQLVILPIRDMVLETLSQ